MTRCLDCDRLMARGSRCADCHRAYDARRGTQNERMALRDAAIRRDGARCTAPESAGRHEGALEVDHVVPVAQGGGNILGNVRTLCHKHHAARYQWDALEATPRSVGR